MRCQLAVGNCWKELHTEVMFTATEHPWLRAAEIVDRTFIACLQFHARERHGGKGLKYSKSDGVIVRSQGRLCCRATSWPHGLSGEACEEKIACQECGIECQWEGSCLAQQGEGGEGWGFWPVRTGRGEVKGQLHACLSRGKGGGGGFGPARIGMSGGQGEAACLTEQGDEVLQQTRIHALHMLQDNCQWPISGLPLNSTCLLCQAQST